MADRRAKPGIKAGAQRVDARLDGARHGLGKGLAGVHPDPVALERRKALDREPVAAGIQPPGQRGQRLARDVDDRAAGHRAFRGPRHVQQDRHRKVAVFRPRLLPDPVAAPAGGAQIRHRPQGGVQIQIVPVTLGMADDAGRAQGLELALDRLDPAAGGGVGDAVVIRRRFDRRHQHAAVIGHPDAASRVPFGIGELARDPFAVHILGRQIQMQLQPGGGRLGDLAQHDFLVVAGGLLGVVQIVVLDPAVDVHHLGPGQHGLELVEDQAVPAVGLVGLQPPRPAGGAVARFLGGAVGGQAGHLVADAAAAAAQVGPHRNRQHRAVSARRLPMGRRVGIGRQQRRGRGQRIAQQMTDQGFDLRFGAAQAGPAAQAQMGSGKPRPQRVQPRRRRQRGPGHRHPGGDGGQIGAERIGFGREAGRMGGCRRQPQIQPLVILGPGKDRQFDRQPQGFRVEAGPGQVFALEGQAPAPGNAVAAGLQGDGLQFDIRRPAETPEQHGDAPAHGVEPDGGIGEIRRRVHARGKQVPQLTHRLLGFPGRDLEMGHASYPVTARTRSKSPLRMSGSSVSGSIIAARMARSRSIPPATRVAA